MRRQVLISRTQTEKSSVGKEPGLGRVRRGRARIQRPRWSLQQAVLEGNGLLALCVPQSLTGQQY